MKNLIDRLNGIYRIPITDGLGPVGDQTDPNEFVRTFETSSINKEAAKKLIDCHDLILELIDHIDHDDFKLNIEIQEKIKFVLNG